MVSTILIISIGLASSWHALDDCEAAETRGPKA